MTKFPFRVFILVRCLASLFAGICLAHSAPLSTSESALLAELSRADGRTIDAHGNLIPAPLDRTVSVQGTADGREISVPDGMRYVPADRAAGTPAFFAGIYEVTQAEYSAFLAAEPRIAAPLGWTGRACRGETANFPVTGIAQADALAYCAWIQANTGRTAMLPSAAQAAALSRGARSTHKASTGQLRAVGDDEHDVSTAGCYDTIGNAVEWHSEQLGGAASAGIGFRVCSILNAPGVSSDHAEEIRGIESGTSAPTMPPVPTPTSEWIQITRQPASRGAAAGSRVELQLEAVHHLGADEGPVVDPICQWFKDGTPIPSATGLKLVLPALQESDVGVYYCTVAIEHGRLTTTSDPVVIALGTTGAVPRITRAQSEVFVASGSTALVSFDFVTPNPSALAVGYSYLSLPTAMTAPDVQTTQSANSTTATWRNVPRDGRLVFTLRVIGAYGTAEASTTVTAINDGAAPAISRHPVGVTVTRGSSATLSVTASGTPAPSFQWARNGTAITGATSASLALSNIQEASTGSYSVTVSNALGSVTSNEASVSLSAPAPSASGSSGGGGGGAPGFVFAAAVTILTVFRTVREVRARR